MINGVGNDKRNIIIDSPYQRERTREKTPMMER